MDQLPAFGTSIFETIGPTYQIYGALLQKQASRIKSTPRKTFTYGPDPRHNLDIYYPSSNPSGADCPILVFIYGGGLYTGSRIIPTVENELVYANVGHFFAEKCGYVVVIPDYRLVPEARFPSGEEDVSLVVDWIRANLKEFGGSDREPRDLCIMGNSAGGVHLCTYLFDPVFAESRRQVLDQGAENLLKLGGVVLLSVPLHFQNASVSRSQVLNAYYGDRIDEDCPLGLLKALRQSSSVSETLPGVKVFVLTGALDPDEILTPNKDFVDAWGLTGSSPAPNLQVGVMAGQNHISPVVSLGTDDPREEAWGFQVADFLTSEKGH